MTGCETNLDKLYLSEVMNHISGTEKDALHIYDALKFASQSYGHTFVTMDFLKQIRKFDEHAVKYDFKIKNKDWKTALDFLEDNNVIFRETFHGDKRVYLTKYWKAEKTIAENIQLLFEQDKDEPSTFDIDYERYGHFLKLLK